MKTGSYIVDGFHYDVEYQPHLSQRDYTQRHVYYVKSDDESYPHAHTAIEDIMNDGSWRHGLYQLKNKQNPSMLNGLHTYHKFEYNEEKDVYVYIFIRPYDD